ncbi:hypothetical protein SBA6_230033 [Candidatus Sulfopaludibacter sp. SbA6]|nr:hypothetical protein SBA6_230033 [Candidatus Sulfopaludibacter sp. SbA6]
MPKPALFLQLAEVRPDRVDVQVVEAYTKDREVAFWEVSTC